MSSVPLALPGPFYKAAPLPEPEPCPPASLALRRRGHDTAPETGRLADPIAIALSYHERTKHHLDRYARSLGYLDWASQPDPFRTFKGALRVELPLAADGLTTPYADLYTPFAVQARPLELKSIAIFFELALGLSAWKEFRGNRWALRCNPSSGNLHPTEGYAILPPLPHLEAGVYHYVSRDHCLERRCCLEGGATDELAEALPASSFLVGLSSIHWREAWKYGERAFRYCQHDAGHALATVRYAAAALGWSGRLLDAPADDDVAALLGLDRAADFAEVDRHDREHPEALILVSLRPASAPPRMLPVATIRAGVWAGQANPLSTSHVDWEVIEDTARATWKPATGGTAVPAVARGNHTPLPATGGTAVPAVARGDHTLLPATGGTAVPAMARGNHTPLPPLTWDGFQNRPTPPAATLIRQRRSCQALDGQTAISAEIFYRMFDHLLPRPGVPPWDALSWPPQLHAGVFVHRVTGLAPGLYLLERDQAIHDRLRAALRPTFLWEKPADCPEHLRLYRLMQGDLRSIARLTSCHQEIGSDGAFSLGMIADFTRTIRRHGAWWYRRLFWEAGVLGQVLYLEAEAAGVRSTGIGCYFDDTFHELLGLAGDEFQDLYHFTVGRSVEDQRLMTIPPYAHLGRTRTE